MKTLLPAFFDELQKIARATLTWGMQKDPRALPRMAPGMYSFGGTRRLLPNDKPGFYKPRTPGFD